MLNLVELKAIQGDKKKLEFVKKNSKNSIFIECLRFLLNNMIVTNISRAKFNKNINIIDETRHLNSIQALLTFLDTECTGKDSDLAIIKDFIDPAFFNTQEIEILEGIVCKDYKVGFGIESFNKAIPNYPIEDSPYMGCIPFNKAKTMKLLKKDKILMSQVKSDGQFLNAICLRDEIRLTSRAGLTQHIGGKLIRELENIRKSNMEDLVLTGELLVNGFTRMVANGMIRGLISSNKKIMEGDNEEYDRFKNKYGISIEDVEDRLEYVVWDMVSIDGFKNKLYEVQYIERFTTVENLLNCSKSKMIRMVEFKFVTSYEQIIEHFKELLARGEEGSIVKSIKEYWRNGKHTYQIKIKLEMEIELRIKGFVEGKEKSDLEGTLGSLYMESEDGLLTTGASGMSLPKRDEIWNAQDFFKDQVATIKCNGVSKNNSGGYSVLYANLIEVRYDKDKANTLKEILEIEKSVVDSKKEIGGNENEKTLIGNKNHDSLAFQILR